MLLVKVRAQLCPRALRFWHSLALKKPHHCRHACEDESGQCHKAAQLFHHLLQRMFFTFRHSIKPSTEFKKKLHVLASVYA